MNSVKEKNFLAYAGRFTLLYILLYFAVGVIFVLIQNALPAESRVALDFFKPYNLGLAEPVTQALRGFFLALVLYPFYDLFVKGKRGFAIMVCALWGVALLGNLEPKPGSIEGMIYTHTALIEHILVLAAGLIQVMLLSSLFLSWERKSIGFAEKVEYRCRGLLSETVTPKWMRGYTFRYTLIHLLVYMIVGSLFYEISGYEEALATMEAFALWRDLESIGMVAVVFFGQIFRGSILALLLYPFYDSYLSGRLGWLKLFGLLFGLKVIPAMFTVPESFMVMLQEAAVGLPEIIAQTFVFAVLFYAWERRRKRKSEAVAT
jgi:hypothetical protein